MFLIPSIGFVKKKGPPPSPVAASYVAQEFDANSNGEGTVTVSVPTHSEGDLLVFVWFGDGGSAADIISAPSGWTNAWDANTPLESNSSFFYVDYRIAGASEPASYQWGLSGSSEEGYAVMFSFTSINPSNPIDQIAGQLLNGGNISASHTAPSITTTTDLTVPVSIWMLNRNVNNSQGYISEPTGMTQISNLASGTGGTGRNDLGLFIAYDLTAVTPAGGYSGKTITSASDVRSYAITLGIRAAGT